MYKYSSGEKVKRSRVNENDADKMEKNQGEIDLPTRPSTRPSTRASTVASKAAKAGGSVGGSVSKGAKNGENSVSKNEVKEAKTVPKGINKADKDDKDDNDDEDDDDR